ncbi:MAG: DASS family sodium-coupled anion symporter [Acidobacteriota bacterium]
MMKPYTRVFQLVLVVIGGLGAGLLLPVPSGIQSSEWQILILFVFTVGAVLWNPYPIGVIVLISLSLGLILGTLSLSQALRGFSNSVTWIIVAAFLFARAFIKTGLGRRIALEFISRVGSSSLRLGYSLALTDLVLAPVTASNTARSGGIIFPIARSLSQEFGSRPGPTAARIGSYLLFTAFQINVITSATFLTAMAANGLSVQLARDAAGVNITWGLWFAAASLPSLISLMVVPYLIYRAYPPQLKETPEARAYALTQLGQLGPMKREERLLSGVFVALALTWATSSYHSISTVAAAFGAVALLLVFEILEWNDVCGEKSAWGTLIWFGGFISLSAALNETGLMPRLIDATRDWFRGWHGVMALLVLVVIYLYLHYGFASMTSQIIALYAAFLAIAVLAGAPKLLAALLLCFFSNLDASLTHYGDGAAPIYFGSGYIDQRSWWRVGFLISIANLLIWLGVGLPWWRLLGIW